MKKEWLCLLLIILLGWSCSDNNSEKKRLDEINNLCEIHPALAMSMLDSIDANDMREEEKHFYEFLTIKARNNADKKLTSDSIILEVIKFYTQDEEKDIYPEVLFHAGIAYSKLGDKPTAIRYLQKSLDRLPPETKRKVLRRKVLGKIGDLLYSIRLYGEAEPYLIASIEMATSANDSLPIMNYTYLLGMINTDAGNFKEAEKNFMRSRNLALKLSPHDTLRCDLNLWAIESTRVRRDSAFIRMNQKEKETAQSKNLVNGAGIYFRSDILDTVFQYAKDSTLKITPEIVNIAYNILTPDLKQSVSQDSLSFYIAKYSNILEKCFKLFLAEPTRFQNSSYNYSLHERERLKAEEHTAKLQKWLMISVFFLLLLIIVLISMRYREKNNLLKLHEALDDLTRLRISLSEQEGCEKFQPESESLLTQGNTDKNNTITVFEKAPDTSKEENLKERLKIELLELRKNCSDVYEVPSCILSSQAYEKIQGFLADSRAIPDNSSIWKELDKTVSRCCPEFKYQLQLLTGGKLKPTDYHMALLIKCGVSPTQLTILVARTKGTISYRRQALFMRIFDENLGASAMDDIIHLL